VNLLLDTHVFLWWDQATALNADTRAVIADPANQIFVSAVSIWEIAIKRRLRKLDFRGSAVTAIGANGFHELPILPIDAENAGALAWQHNDPFDRILARRRGA
jgi:PIN domain nuclease of toxin-antitoxin system